MIKKTVKLCLLVSILSLQASSHLFAMDDGEKDEIKRLQIKKEKYTSKIDICNSKIVNYRNRLSEVEYKLEKLSIKASSEDEDLTRSSSDIPPQPIPSITKKIPIIKDPEPFKEEILTSPPVKKSSDSSEILEFLNRWREFEPQKFSTVYKGYHMVIVEIKGSHNVGIRRDKTNDARNWINNNESLEAAKRAAFEYVRNK